MGDDNSKSDERVTSFLLCVCVGSAPQKKKDSCWVLARETLVSEFMIDDDTLSDRKINDDALERDDMCIATASGFLFVLSSLFGLRKYGCVFY